MDSYTTSWSSFIGALRDTYGVPLVPLVPEVNLEGDPEEDPKEESEDEENPKDDPNKDPMDDEEGTSEWKLYYDIVVSF